MAVGAAVINNYKIANVNFGQRTIDSEFIIIFTQGACDIICIIQGLILFTEYGDVMISSVK